MNKITVLGLLIGLTVVAAPLFASAQCIEVTSDSCDYGDVKVGTGESQIITIHSCATSDLTVYYIGIMEDPTGVFSMSPVPDVPFPLDGGETLEVQVTFTPPDLGVHEAFLYIVHNATGGETEIDLSGVGVRGWRCSAAKIAP
jgi:hypothetical protein